MSNHDKYGVQTGEETLDCNTLKIQIKTNDTLDSYVKVTVKCDVKCSLAQQYTYKRLMESADKDEFGYGVGKYTLLDDYWARARRIAATYARFCLEEEDGCDKQLQGRYYWMGLGAFASKTVGCMFNAWQVKYVSVAFRKLAMDKIYEGLGKGNFWLFQDIASWHYLYNMSVTKGEGYEGFVQCRDMKSADTLCETPQNIVKNKLPWASESLPLVGNLARPTGQEAGELEKGMKKVHEIEIMIIKKKTEEDIQKSQFSHLINIAKHEQGNILQPLIYKDPRTWSVDFQDWLPIMRGLSFAMPEVKLVLQAECDESVTNVLKENEKNYEGYEEAYKQEEFEHAKAYSRLGGMYGGIPPQVLNDMVKKEMKDGPLAQAYKQKVGKEPLRVDDTVSRPQKGMILEDYKSRMFWIKQAAEKYHNVWRAYPNYMKSELATIASWVDTPDQFSDKFLATKEY
jgi:hypothetical protein